jgi:zinc D-Ala-D-Ala dipeptidase
MIFGYMNYVRHPDNPAWRVFVYRTQEVGQMVADRVQAEGIWCSLEEAPNDNQVWMLVIEKKDFDKVFAHNAAVMNNHRPPLIPDSFLRKLLIGVLFFGTGLAITGALITNFREKTLRKSALNSDGVAITLPKSESAVLSELEVAMQDLGWVGVRSLDSTIFVDLKYAGDANISGEVLYPELSDAYLHTSAAAALVKAHSFLKEEAPGLRFLIYDAGRPRSVQIKLHEQLIAMGLAGTTYVSNPRKGSVHNFGMAVDLTLADTLGNPLDMGTDFDFFGPEAHPELEDSMMMNGKLNSVQVQNRRLLRKAMRRAGFSIIDSEWWHFNLYSRETIPEGTPILE